jgi:putative transposase
MSGMEKAYRYRFYPTTEQESLLRRTMGCVRLVYNKALAARTDAWYRKPDELIRANFLHADKLEKREDLDF